MKTGRDLEQKIEDFTRNRISYLEDHPMTSDYSKWLTLMVRFHPLRIGLFPFQMAMKMVCE